MTAMHLFSPLTLRGVTLPNRIVISPMQQYAAGPDGPLRTRRRRRQLRRSPDRASWAAE